MPSSIVQCIVDACIVDALSMHCLRIVDALSMHCRCIVSALSLHCLRIVSALSLHCLRIVFALCIHCRCIVHALSTHCLCIVSHHSGNTCFPLRVRRHPPSCNVVQGACMLWRHVILKTRWTFASLLRTRLELQNRSITLMQCTAFRLACVKPVAIADGEETTANHFTCRARSWWKPAQSWPP